MNETFLLLFLIINFLLFFEKLRVLFSKCDGKTDLEVPIFFVFLCGKNDVTRPIAFQIA